MYRPTVMNARESSVKEDGNCRDVSESHFMLQFQYPELFLLGLPLAWAFRRLGPVTRITACIRAVVLAALVTALTGPRLNVHGRGLDVVVVADRSRSVSAEAQSNIRELVTNLQKHVANRDQGDRLALVTFGSEPHVEFELSAQMRSTDYLKEVNSNGSDLHDAIQMALDRVSPNRPARILLLSDGEANGRDPLSAARRARELGVPIDARLFERPKIGDVAIESVQMPDSVAVREPFQYSVWVHADHPVVGTLRVLREGRVIQEQERSFQTGTNRLLFRDVLDEDGFFNYSIELKVAGDAIEENNRGAGLVRVEAGPRLLVLNGDGQPGNLVRALQAGKIPVDVAAAATHSLSQDSLDKYRAVVIENVKADDLGRLKMERLGQFVEDLGGGLMLTGGQRSFGTGGYFLSPLDALLPVSMEVREEHKKVRAAIAIALDRSGSMSVTVKGGRTKMDLADRGTAACVSLLSPQDMVAVIAVDSEPHVIQPLAHVDDPNSINRRVLRIQSMGGGIYVYEALVAAGRELLKAEGYTTRHIILFSDAADSEMPGDYVNLLKKYADSGITVSVIGLGTKADPDAKLLEDIARLGGGNIMFTSDAEELPRLFTQDTLSVARNTFITKEDTQPNGIAGKFVPDARLLGNFEFSALPTTDGYNLSYIKPDATMVAVSDDEYQAPWSAAWNRGLGRVAAITLEVDGKFSGQFAKWDDYDRFLVTHARWLMGSTNPEQVFVRINQVGQEATMQVELDADRKTQDETRPPKIHVVPPGDERATVLHPDLFWTGPHTLEARFRMDRPGSYRTLVQTGPKSLTRGPAVTLPYSPEFAPRLGLPDGPTVLKQIAEVSAGKLRTDVLEVFADPPRTSRTASLVGPLLWLALLLLLLEIAGRRLSLWERLPEFSELALPRRSASKPQRRAVSLKSLWDMLARSKSSVDAATSNEPLAGTSATSASTPASAAAPIATPAATSSDDSHTPNASSNATSGQPPSAADSANLPTAASVFERAKDRARRRTD